nr:hypothetical protein [Escherichia coli]
MTSSRSDAQSCVRPSSLKKKSHQIAVFHRNHVIIEVIRIGQILFIY